MRHPILLAAMVASAAAFAAILVTVVQTHGAIAVDGALNAGLAPFRVAPVVATSLWITALAAGPALTAVLATAVALLWACNRAPLIVGLVVSFGGAQATSWTLKYLVGRPRPPFIQAVQEGSPSFPSGHATASLALYGFLAFAVARAAAGRRGRWVVPATMVAVVCLVDLSRAVLSLHFATDIIAGNLVGGFWLMAGCLVVDRPHADRGLGGPARLTDSVHALRPRS